VTPNRCRSVGPTLEIERAGARRGNQLRIEGGEGNTTKNKNQKPKGEGGGRGVTKKKGALVEGSKIQWHTRHFVGACSLFCLC